MLTQEQENFFKIVLLLYEVSPIVLEQIIVIVTITNGGDLDKLLRISHDFLPKVFCNNERQLNKLFPSDSARTNTATWDIQMFTNVILFLPIFNSTLSPKTRKKVKCIKKVRNEIIAHSSSASMYTGIFEEQNKKLIEAITTLAEDFDESIQKTCKDLISKVLNDTFDGKQDSICKRLQCFIDRDEILEKLTRTQEVICCKIKDSEETVCSKVTEVGKQNETHLENLYKRNHKSLESEFKKMDNNIKRICKDRTTEIKNSEEHLCSVVKENNDQVIQVLTKLEAQLKERNLTSADGKYVKTIKYGVQSKLKLTAHCEKCLNTAEKVIKETFDLCLNGEGKSGCNPETEKKIRQFIDYIRKFPDLELKGAEISCILLHFVCSTYQSLIEWIRFIDSTNYSMFLDELAIALEKDLKQGQCIKFSFSIPIEKLQIILPDTSNEVQNESQSHVKLAFECKSDEALSTIMDMFVKGNADCYFDGISEAVSKYVRSRIHMSAESLDFKTSMSGEDGLKDELSEECDDGLIGFNEDSLMKSPKLELFQQQTEGEDNEINEGMRKFSVLPGFAASSEAKEVAEISQKLADSVIETDTEAFVTATKIGDMTDSTFVYAAIDFGTAYSGYAFAFRNELQENLSQIHGKNWQHCFASKLSKTPSVILFNESKCFDSFGYEAEEKYARLAREYKHQGWRYFKQFKMVLHGKKKLRLNLSLIDDQGNKMPAIDIFAAAIKHLKDDLIKTLGTGSPHIGTDNIMWIITVPTIWNYGAKQFMKEAAVRAGISEHRFTFALEPEAGAVYCAHIENAAGRESILRENSEFMVVDLGGGTADITVCKVETDKTLSELYPPSGGPWGGNSVDRNIYRLLEEYFGMEIMQNMDKHHKTDYLEVREGIERKKRDFGKSDSKEVRFNIPYQLVDMNRVSKSDITREHKHSLGESVQLVESKNQVRISNEKFEEMFWEPIQHLTEHLKNLFVNPKLAEVDTILMIGGFSESTVMQNAVKKSFPNRKVVIPDEPELAVVKGAVIVGYRNSCIRSRKLPYTYGISTAVPFDPNIHSQQKMFFPPGSPYPKCEDIFKPFIHKGSTIIPGITKVHHSNFTVDSTSKTAHIEVYQSFADTLTNPSYVTDPEVEMTGILELTLESNPMAKETNSQETILYKRVSDNKIHSGSELSLESKSITEESEPELTDKRMIDITMHFGAFEVEVEAKEHGTQSAVRAKFNCLYH